MLLPGSRRGILSLAAALIICRAADTGVSGLLLDPQGAAVAGAAVRLTRSGSPAGETRTDGQGQFRFNAIAPGEYDLAAEAPGLARVTRSVTIREGRTEFADLRFSELAARNQNVVITAKPVEPSIDLRNAEVFNRTLFTRDDQVLQQLNAGINAGQHEGGGKSLEIRRFGFNLDHGGVNGGLKVLVDDRSEELR